MCPSRHLDYRCSRVLIAPSVSLFSLDSICLSVSWLAMFSGLDCPLRDPWPSIPSWLPMSLNILTTYVLKSWLPPPWAIDHLFPLDPLTTDVLGPWLPPSMSLDHQFPKPTTSPQSQFSKCIEDLNPSFHLLTQRQAIRVVLYHRPLNHYPSLYPMAKTND